MLESWQERSQVVAHLLNPAFVGVVIRRAVIGYQSVTHTGMPFLLAPLVPALVLHAGTREKLPTIRTSFASWLQEHRELVIDLPQRISELVPYCKESILFAAQLKAITLGELGALHDGPAKMTGKSKFPRLSSEINECWRQSEFVGRWLAGAGSVETIYALLGIAP